MCVCVCVYAVTWMYVRVRVSVRLCKAESRVTSRNSFIRARMMSEREREMGGGGV